MEAAEATPRLEVGDHVWVTPGEHCPWDFTAVRRGTVVAVKPENDGALVAHGSSGVQYGWARAELLPLAAVPWRRRLWWTLVGFVAVLRSSWPLCLVRAWKARRREAQARAAYLAAVVVQATVEPQVVGNVPPRRHRTSTPAEDV